ncbi:MAG: hypothetical protein Q7U78_11805 [Gallionella sp.]|nr:hypothetical protein [Gallionella sp.]
MKKIVLSIAGVMAAAAFAPEASALPAFARQTGMACTACHAQHFPVLNGFGRSFKAAGYTMMGAQEKVEGDHLSIPNALNAAILAKVRYQKDNTVSAKVLGTDANGLADGQLQFGDEFSLFFGGRAAENIGFLFEGNTVAAGAQLLAGFKLPINFDMGGVKLGVTPFTTDALGVQYGYELSSGGVMRANRWAEHRREVSAVQYNADRGVDAGGATGFALSAQNDMGFIAITKWAPSFGMGANGAAIPSHDMKSTYIRVAATPTVGDWAMVVGAGSMSGTSGTGGVAIVDTKQTFFDFQAQGEVAGKEMGVYLQHASAPATINGNSYNGSAAGVKIVAGLPVALAAGDIGASTRTAWTIGADYTIIPHTLSLGAAYRNAKTGNVVTAAQVLAGRGTQDNAITLTAVYDLVQNVALHINHSQYSGNSRNFVGAQKNLTTLMLEAAW